MGDANGQEAVDRQFSIVNSGLQCLFTLSDQSFKDERIFKDPASVLEDFQKVLEETADRIRKEIGILKDFNTLTHSQTIPGTGLIPLIDTRIEYIIEPICPIGTLTLVQGMPKSGKSTFSLWISLCAALGLPCSELFKIEKPRRVLFVEFEDNPILIAKRSARYLAGAGWDAYAIPDNFNLCDSPQLWLETETYEKALTKEIHEKQYELIVIDTLSYVHNMDDENASAQMKLVMASLKRIVKATNSSIIMIHHSKKGAQNGTAPNEKARGSSSISAAADVILDWGDRGGTDTTPVQVISKYDDSLNFSVEYKRVPEGIQWIITEGASEEKAQAIDATLAVVRELLITSPSGVSGSAVFKVLEQQGAKQSTVYYQLGKLAKNKVLLATPKGRETVYTIMTNVL